MSIWKRNFKEAIKPAMGLPSNGTPQYAGLPPTRALEAIEKIIGDKAATAEERVGRIRKCLSLCSDS